jgi:hypothetical protein
MEFDTKRASETESLLKEWRSKFEGKVAATHDVLARDHTRTDHYVAIAEFPSHDEAERNRKLWDTDKFATRMATLCDGPVEYRDYDVIGSKS